jgi:hypothetical protein
MGLKAKMNVPVEFRLGIADRPKTEFDRLFCIRFVETGYGEPVAHFERRDAEQGFRQHLAGPCAEVLWLIASVDRERVDPQPDGVLDISEIGRVLALNVKVFAFKRCSRQLGIAVGQW